MSGWWKRNLAKEYNPQRTARVRKTIGLCGVATLLSGLAGIAALWSVPAALVVIAFGLCVWAFAATRLRAAFREPHWDKTHPGAIDPMTGKPPHS